MAKPAKREKKKPRAVRIAEYHQALVSDPTILERVAPVAVAPRFSSRREPDESDLIYEALFRERDWGVLAQQGLAPPSPPLEWFHRNDRTILESPFLVNLLRDIGDLLPPMLPMTPDVRHLRASLDPLSPAAVVYLPIVDCLAAMDEVGASNLTRYRTLLVVRWLVGQLDKQEGLDDRIASNNFLLANKRLERIRAKCAELAKLLGLSEWPTTRKHLEQDDPAADDPNLHQDLPALLLAWPDSLKRLARSLLAIPESDVSPGIQRQLHQLLITGEFSPRPSYPISLQAQYQPMASPQFKTAASRRIDPFARLAARTLSKVFALDARMAPKRIAHIERLLNAAYPKGYRTPDSRVGARPPTGRWEKRTIERWL